MTYRVIAYNRSRDKTEEIIGEGLEGGFAPEEVVGMLAAPRIVWLSVAILAAVGLVVVAFNSWCTQSRRPVSAEVEALLKMGVRVGLYGHLRNGLSLDDHIHD